MATWLRGARWTMAHRSQGDKLLALASNEGLGVIAPAWAMEPRREGKFRGRGLLPAPYSFTATAREASEACRPEPIARLSASRTASSVSTWREPCLRWLASQLVRVGICKAPCLALALGLPRMALSVGWTGTGKPFSALSASPLAACLAAILGATTPRTSSQRTRPCAGHFFNAGS